MPAHRHGRLGLTASAVRCRIRLNRFAHKRDNILHRTIWAQKRPDHVARFNRLLDGAMKQGETVGLVFDPHHGRLYNVLQPNRFGRFNGVEFEFRMLFQQEFLTFGKAIARK